IKPYNDALQGFRAVSKARTNKLVSSEMGEQDIVGKVRKIKPDLILAIGMDALAKVRGIRDVPIVYLMVLNPQALVQDNANVTGVSMNIAPERQLSLLRQILPQVKKIALFFDPGKSGNYVDKAYSAAAIMGIELLAKGVHSPREAIAAIDSMKGKADALWLLPDTTVVNPATIDLLLLSTLENKIPVLTFSDKYVEKGALMSLEVDAEEAGRQAGEMANRIQAGAAVQSIEKEDARGGILTVNLIVAKKLGISINRNVVKHARIIR
ncbi:MAG TPA: ABC transporter substrate-binding protein, partial [Geobacteraceae bacterium]|nr:ABC transporter substrate-binding protein [Geobacteraceae bacterium]